MKYIVCSFRLYENKQNFKKTLLLMTVHLELSLFEKF